MDNLTLNASSNLIENISEVVAEEVILISYPARVTIGVFYFLASIAILIMYTPFMIAMYRDSELKTMGKLDKEVCLGYK